MYVIHPILLEQIAEAYRQERLRAAHAYQLYRQSQPPRDRHAHLYCRFFIWFGRQLVNLGLHLQTRHGVAENAQPVVMQPQPRQV